MQDSVTSIRTVECDICGRFDTVMLSDDEIKARAKVTDMEVGAYSIIHSDHTRIVYFDKEGQYLGDTIAMTQDEVSEKLKTQPLPYYIHDKEKMGLFKRLRKLLFSKLYTRNLTITIAGPSKAGKTSFTRYLETLVPERDRRVVPSVPTMGKSTKRISLGNSIIKTLDMGGQQDFWELWGASIEGSSAIIFIVDGTSNNVLEIAKAFEKVINAREDETPILVILNKKDLSLRGQANRFISSGEFLALTNLTLPIPQVVAIEASIFEGIAYSSVELEEEQLIEIISAFLDDYC